MDLDDKYTCGICYVDYNSWEYANDFETLLCAHRICKTCFLKILEIGNFKCPFCRADFYPIKINNSRSNFLHDNPPSEFNEDLLDNFQVRQRNPRRRRRNNYRRQHGENRIIPDDITEGSMFPMDEDSHIQQAPVSAPPRVINDKIKQKKHGRSSNRWNSMKCSSSF